MLQSTGGALPHMWISLFLRIAMELASLPTAVVCQDASLVNVLLQLSTEWAHVAYPLTEGHTLGTYAVLFPLLINAFSNYPACNQRTTPRLNNSLCFLWGATGGTVACRRFWYV